MCGVCRAVRVAKASPRGTLSFGDPPGDAAPRADRAPRVPLWWVSKAWVLAAPGPVVLVAAFFGKSRPETLEAQVPGK